MMPARQRLKTSDVPFYVRLRLIVQRKLIPRNRQAQIVLKGASLPQLFVHRDFKEANRPTHFGFSAEQRGVGVCDERRRINAILRIYTDADREPDAQNVAVDFDVGIKRRRQSLGQRL